VTPPRFYERKGKKRPLSTKANTTPSFKHRQEKENYRTDGPGEGGKNELRKTDDDPPGKKPIEKEEQEGGEKSRSAWKAIHEL